MSGYRTIGIEYHGPPLDHDGRYIPNAPSLHIRVMLGADGDEDLCNAIFQLESHEDLRREDGTCRVCQPRRRTEEGSRPPYKAVEALQPCQGCGQHIQPGQSYHGPPTAPLHIGCEV